MASKFSGLRGGLHRSAAQRQPPARPHKPQFRKTWEDYNARFPLLTPGQARRRWLTEMLRKARQSRPPR